MKSNAQKIFEAVGADAALTEQEDLRRYLTGFEAEFGYVLTDKSGTTLYTDTRYTEAAGKFFSGSDIKVELFERGATAYSLLEGYKSVAIPVGMTLAPVYNELKKRGFEIVDSTKAIVDAMSQKSDDEIERISKACDIADRAIEKLYGYVKEGMTETEVAAMLEYYMRSMGASGTSFDTICAFGPNGSMPHYETGIRKLKFGDVVLIDYGCKYKGYCSDSTRTFLFGDDGKKDDFKKAYGVVLDAQLLAIDSIRPGMTGREADAVAREHLKKHGLDTYFTHSLGHGLGLNIHEAPRLSPGSDDVLREGMVFSDEPGVYFPDGFGIRIEDTLVLRGGGPEKLTHSDKKLLTI
ncbi:MAG: aminopeptidase P family protein [Clostridia bacterium]|nr:aminopeptidase P family protein [Clostridia bacterium]